MTKFWPFILLWPYVLYAQEKESWIDLDSEQWPQIALTNHVQFKNGDRYIDPSFEYAGTGFLIDTGSDTLAATAKHVLWVAKNSESLSVEVNEQLDSWIMRPKSETKEHIVIDQLLNEDSTEQLQGYGSSITERDWLIFTVKKTSPNIYPLKPRFSAIKKGEKVYILSCAYEDPHPTVSKGKLLRKEGMDLLLERKSSKNKPGSSGSPVIDARGHLIGILSSATIDHQTGEHILVAVSTEYLEKVLLQKEGFNEPKKDYGALIFDLVLNMGAKVATRKYRSLVKDPRNYYIYNLRSSHRNGLREAGEKLLELNRIKEAIHILKLNAKVQTHFYLHHNLLAQAYVRAGKTRKAIKSYGRSIDAFDDETKNDAFAQLEELLVRK